MRKSIKHIILAVSAVIAGAACEKAPEAPALQAARIDVTISTHLNEDGAIDQAVWNTRDVVGFLFTESATPSLTTVSPITPDAPSSRFTFSTDAKEGDNIFAFYPASAAIYTDGNITTRLPERQDGTITPFFIGSSAFSSSPVKMTINPAWCTVYAKVSIGNYSIKKAVMTGNNGEKIAGDITINPENLKTEASETSVTVEFSTPLDCRLSEISFPISIAPVTFTKGYTIVYTTETGEEITYTTEENTVAEMSGRIDVGGAKGNKATELLVCGDNHLYLIDARVAATQGFEKAILWHWDAKSVMETIGKDGLRLDDCKPVDNNTKILVTSSRGFALLLDKETEKMLWYSNSSIQAHSAELLPGNRIAVACSTGGDCVQIFDIATPNKVVFSDPLDSAHGVVWNEKKQRLYAIGGTSLKVYKLKDWESSEPKLTLDKIINTSSFVTGLHDLTYVGPKTLLLAGRGCALYNIENDSFLKLNRFNSSTALKSVNYNETTGECWYVDATRPEGDFSWSSKTIHYTDNVQSSKADKLTISDIPINMYKCRVFNW